MRPYTLPLHSCHSDIQWYESPPSPEWIEITNIENTRPTDPNQGAILEVVRNEDQTTDLPLRARWIGVDPIIPEPQPSPAIFYHAIQASSEFQAIDAWAILNAVEPAATLLSRAMSVVLEAKAYADQFGGSATSFDAVQARLSQFVVALDDTTDYGGTTKAEIVVRIEAAIKLSHLPITPAFIEV